MKNRPYGRAFRNLAGTVIVNSILESYRRHGVEPLVHMTAVLCGLVVIKAGLVPAITSNYRNEGLLGKTERTIAEGRVQSDAG